MGTWNVQGLNTKKKEVFDELEKANIDIGILTETKKKGRGSEMIGQYIHFYSGIGKDKRAKRGVSIAVHKRFKRYIKKWDQIDERIISLELQIHGHTLVIIGVYAPNNDADITVKDSFFNKLTGVVEIVNQRKEIIMLGDFNGRIGKMNGSLVVGKYGEETVNDNGRRLIDLCESTSLKILNGFFPHKRIHQYTWVQPTKKLASIIDYVIQRQNPHIKTTDVRAHRGPECGTDHYLLKAHIHLKFRRVKQDTQRELQNKK